jgi:hydroxypyruvate isomerase
MGSKINPSRRSALKKIAGSAAVAIAGVSLSHRLSATEAVLDENSKEK